MPASLWDYVSTREGRLGLSVDTAGIATALLGGMVGAFTDIGVTALNIGFMIVTRPLDWGRRVIVGFIGLLDQVLPGLVSASAAETARGLADFDFFAFAVGLGVVLLSVWLLAKARELGVAIFG